MPVQAGFSPHRAEVDQIAPSTVEKLVQTRNSRKTSGTSLIKPLGTWLLNCLSFDMHTTLLLNLSDDRYKQLHRTPIELRMW